MAISDFGLSTALAVKTGAGDAAAREIEDLKYFDQLRKQNDAMNMAKAKMFSDDLQFQNGSNPYDSKIIQNENRELVQQLGRFVRENPDWATNIEKNIQLQQMKKSMMNTPAVLRSVAYKDSIKRFNDDLAEVAKDPKRYNTNAYNAIRQQVDNYNKYGNQDGAEAFAREGAKVFTYQKPRDFINLAESAQKRGSAVEMNPYTMDYNEIKNGRDAAYQVTPKKFIIDALANDEYQNNKEQYDFEYGPKALDKAREFITSSIKTEYHIGNRNPVTDALAIAAGKARLKAIEDAKVSGRMVDPYALLMNDKYAKDDPKTLAATFGSNVPFYYSDANGKIVKEQGPDFYYEGDIFDKGFNINDPDAKYEKTGIKIMPGYVYKTLQWGQDSGFLRDPWGPTRYELRPEFQDRMEIVDGPIKDGKAEKLLQIKAFNEVAANSPNYALKYNKQFTTTKQRDALGINESFINQQVYEDEVGNKFILDPNGTPIPYNE